MDLALPPTAIAVAATTATVVGIFRTSAPTYSSSTRAG